MDKILLKIKRKGYSPLVNYLDYMGKWHGSIFPNPQKGKTLEIIHVVDEERRRHAFGRSPMAVAKKLLKLMEELEELEENKPMLVKWATHI